MRLIVITLPHFFDREAAAITALFRNGLETLHLRKPGASAEDVKYLLEQLPKEYMSRIVTHEHFRLVPVFGLKGIHLNGRNPQVPAEYTGHISCSCHSLDEVIQRKAGCEYVFLSPICDSISKEGYASAYTYEGLLKARQQGIIDAKVVALGGIAMERLPEIRSLGFGGVALLGDVWQRKERDILTHFLHLKEACLLS